MNKNPKSSQNFLKKIHNHVRFIAFLCTIGVLFAGLAILISFFPIPPLDILISQGIQQQGEDLAFFIMQALSFFGEVPVAIVMIGGIFFWLYMSGNRKEAFFLFGTIIADIVNVGLKLLINRPRPTDDLVTIAHVFTDTSFPSGHTVHYTVFFGYLIVIMFFIKNIPTLIRILVTIISVILIGGISVSRIYLGAHWASDTVGGYLVGILFLSSIIYWYLQMREKRYRI